MTFHHIRRVEDRSQSVEAADKYLPWWRMCAVLRFDASPKLQNDLSYASVAS
jgi:hypothetical protein